MIGIGSTGLLPIGRSISALRWVSIPIGKSWIAPSASSKRALAQDFAPRLPTSFEQSGLGRHAILLGVVAEEFDRAASRRIEENRALRGLFADAVKTIPNSDLRSRLQAACETEDRSFKVRDLDKSNCGLRSLLIELHEHVEQLAGDKAKSLEEAIWRELACSTERRCTSLNRF
jgi:hypothetical protein